MAAGKGGKAVAKYRPPSADHAIPLDEPINAALGSLNRAIVLWKAVEPSLDKFVPYLAELVETGREAEKYFSRKTGKEVTEGEWAREVAHDLATLLEKLSRTAVNLVKVTDEAARLRDLLTGGADVREDIATLGDRELQDILVETVLARGLWRLIRQRAAERGVVIEGEVVSAAIAEEK
jgi:hypothetical protein